MINDKIVEIANFRQADRAEVLASVLRAEGIECYVRNEVSTRTFGGLVDIGARVEVLESNVARALEIAEIGGFFAQEDERDLYPGLEEERGCFLRKFSFEKRMIIILVLLAILVTILLYLGYNLSEPKY